MGNVSIQEVNNISFEIHLQVKDVLITYTDIAIQKETQNLLVSYCCNREFFNEGEDGSFPWDLLTLHLTTFPFIMDN